MNNLNHSMNFLTIYYQTLKLELDRQNSLNQQKLVNLALAQAAIELINQSFIQSSSQSAFNSLANFNFNKIEKEKNAENSNTILHLKATDSTVNLSCSGEDTKGDYKRINLNNVVCETNLSKEATGEKTNSEKNRNVDINNNNKIKFYKCSYADCGKTYKSKENLNLHVKNKHLGIKPYACKFCENRFSHRNGKTYHERKMHLNILPFECNKENCKSAFASKSALRYHLENQHK